MIHEIGTELEELLKARGCPLPVVDGPEFNLTAWGKDRVVIETAGGDAFIPVKRISHNPKRFAIRRIGVQIRVFARVDRAGAQPFEHRRKTDHALDLVYVALEKIAKTRGNEFTLRTTDYYTPPDIAPSDVPNGCAYQMQLFWDRSVDDRDWKYNAADEGTIAHVETTFTPVTTS